jgi:uncharacterized protein
MKRLLRWCVFPALLAAPALCVDFSALKPLGYVSDFAGGVDQPTRLAVERYCAAVDTSAGVQMALVTLPTLAGEPIEDVANLLFRKWGVGQKGSDEGILLLLVIQDRRSRLEVGYGLEPYIPDGFAGSLLRQMRPALQAGQYGEAMAAAAQTIGSRVAEAKQVTIQSTPVRRRAPASRQPVPWGSLVGGLVMMLWLFGLGRGRRGRGFGGGFLTAMVLGNLLGRGMHGYGGRSGGGFGGFDSSDSFGGFGGGDSGGGGASGGW